MQCGGTEWLSVAQLSHLLTGNKEGLPARVIPRCHEEISGVC